MRGMSNRTKALLAPGDGTTKIIQAINRLPFGYVGLAGERASGYAPVFANTWEAITFTPTLDLDGMFDTPASTATVPDGCDGVWVAVLTGSVSSSTGLFQVLVNGVAAVTFTLSTTARSLISLPFQVPANARLAFEYQASLTSITLVGGAQLSFHRLGLAP
jgi:hypothetical protein